MGPSCQVEESLFLRVIRSHFLVCGRGPSCQSLHVQSTSDGCRSLTTLTRPRREHQGDGRWRGLGRGRHGAGEDAAVDVTRRGVRGFTGSLRCEAAVAAE